MNAKLKDFPAKLNIYAAVSGQLHDLCLEANALFAERYENGINFSGIHIPHITLAVAEVHKPSDYKEVVYGLDCLSKRNSPIVYQTNGIVKGMRGGSYVMVVITNNLALSRLRTQVLNSLPDDIRDGASGERGSSPHISIGFTNEIIEGGLRQIDKKFHGIASRVVEIGLSRSGLHGTCIEKLEGFKLTG